MPGVAAARLDLQFPGGKVDLVVEDDNIGGVQFEEAHRFGHRVARQVHECARLEKRHAFAAQAALAQVALELAAKGGEGVIAGDLVDRHETDVVSVLCIFGPGVAEADEQSHWGAFRLRPAI